MSGAGRPGRIRTGRPIAGSDPDRLGTRRDQAQRVRDLHADVQAGLEDGDRRSRRCWRCRSPSTLLGSTGRRRASAGSRRRRSGSRGWHELEATRSVHKPLLVGPRFERRDVLGSRDQNTWRSRAPRRVRAGSSSTTRAGRSAHVGTGTSQFRASQFVAQLEPVLPGATARWNGRAVVDFWTGNKWTNGSYSYYKPGQFSKFAGVEGERSGELPLRRRAHVDRLLRVHERRGRDRRAGRNGDPGRPAVERQPTARRAPLPRLAAGAQRSRAIASVSSGLEWMPSFRYTFRRWYSIVFGLRKIEAAASRVVRPSASSSAIWSSCGVSWSSVDGSRRRAVSPVASSSTRARFAHGSAPSESKASIAARSSLARADAPAGAA